MDGIMYTALCALSLILACQIEDFSIGVKPHLLENIFVSSKFLLQIFLVGGQRVAKRKKRTVVSTIYLTIYIRQFFVFLRSFLIFSFLSLSIQHMFQMILSKENWKTIWEKIYFLFWPKLKNKNLSFLKNHLVIFHVGWVWHAYR